MRAMILAAGLGTRLRPLTDDRPKALVEINGRTLLEITLRRLRQFGVREVILNAHHFAEMIASYLRSRDFGMRIEISHEEELLDTGGGLKRVADFFLEDPSQPFVVHNVDVLSSIDLARMAQHHREKQALATLAVQSRSSSRHLLFNQELELCGRKAGDEVPDLVRPVTRPEPLAFCGIHMISPRIFQLMNEEGAFSIIAGYLRLARQGEKILGFRADEYYWRDLGTPQSLEQAARDLRRGALDN
jgi:NDP-sugar pyrophosphorylase family protein